MQQGCLPITKLGFTSMRFEISLDEFLDDGRVVVTNSSNYGHQAGPEHSALVLSGAFNE